MEIRKGDKFLCIKDVVMLDPPHKIAYIKGRVYTSEVNGCITNEYGNDQHSWSEETEDPEDYKMSDVFKRVHEEEDE